MKREVPIHVFKISAMNIVIGDLVDDRFEIVERKGIGHPDTLCDDINEQISVALSNYYYNQFGAVMHHNVDKALLIGGQSRPAYLGGEVITPISVIVAGRATHEVENKKVPVQDIALDTAKQWIKDHIRHIQADRNVLFDIRIRPGSDDLVELFCRFGRGEVPLANDTSFGAGYFPLSNLEKYCNSNRAVVKP